MATFRWGYRLNRVATLLNEHAHQLIRPHGIGILGMRVLLWLLERDPVRVGELAADARIEPSAMSHTLRRLEARGLLERRPDAEDNRSVVVTLTAKGRQLAKSLMLPLRIYDSAVVSGFSAEEVDLLERFLVRMDFNVSQLASPLPRRRGKTGPKG